MTYATFPLIAVDIGNTRLKLGLFSQPVASELPKPQRTLTLSPQWLDSELEKWLGAPAHSFAWRISSVQRTASKRLVDWLIAAGCKNYKVLLADDLPLDVALEFPDRVGMDRLVDAVSVNQLRASQHAAVIVDLGTAITVDLVDEEGVFLGGTILPGIAMSARALHEFTDLLPLVDMSELHDQPAVLGTSTTLAMQSGLYFGAVGAMRELITRLSADHERVQVYLTGGAAPAVADLLSDGDALSAARQAVYVPHLTLAGIALAAASEYER